MLTVGLVTKDPAKLSHGSQGVMLFGVLTGSLVLLSAAPLAIRRVLFRRLSGVPRGASKQEIAPADCEGRPYTYRQVVEYRALGKLLRAILWYFLAVQLLGFLLLGALLAWDGEARALCEAAGASPYAAGLFLAVSAFNNAGLSLFPDSLESLRRKPAPLLAIAVLILLGNTFYPVALRCIIAGQRWANARGAGGAGVPAGALAALLGVPLPPLQTRALAALNLAFVALQLASELALNRPPFAPYANLSAGVQLVAAFTQAVSTRAAGFEVVNTTELNPALVLLLVALMLVGSYPYIVTMRLTAEDNEGAGKAGEGAGGGAAAAEAGAGAGAKRRTLVEVAAKRARRLATSELALLFLAAQLIAMSELSDGAKAARAARGQGLVRIVFETTSAFGNVGLSLADGELAPGASYCATFNAASKLLLLAVMLYGRQRGLPSALDAAVVEIGLGVRAAAQRAGGLGARAGGRGEDAADEADGPGLLKQRRRVGVGEGLARALAPRAAGPAGGGGVPLAVGGARGDPGEEGPSDGSVGGEGSGAQLLSRHRAAASLYLRAPAGPERAAALTPPPLLPGRPLAPPPPAPSPHGPAGSPGPLQSPPLAPAAQGFERIS
eukprot:tig00000480_g1329.t1